jgi:3-phosphoshikimate 1-carboxyvinyltransferase
MRSIKPSAISGKVDAPASKSLMIRATAAALLARGESRILEPSLCADALAGLRVARALGADVVGLDAEIGISGGGDPRQDTLDCGESGLCMRMFTPIAALWGRLFLITGDGSLSTRPMGLMEQPLGGAGVLVRTRGGFPPLSVKGPLRGGRIAIDGSQSSQFLSGLLMALPICTEDSEVRVENLKSGPYAAMTISLLARFGVAIDSDLDLRTFRIAGGQRYRGTTYKVEGDWSAGAFLLTAGAVAGDVTVGNLDIRTEQADRKVVEALESAGAGVTVADGSISIRHAALKGFDFDATDCPDLFPPLVALACFCRGRTRISGAERLKHKESDRAVALLEEFTALGAGISLDGDTLEIDGGRLKGGVLDAHNDHRIAMAGAVAALGSEGGVSIRGSDCVSKSYPGFFGDLKSLGGDVT